MPFHPILANLPEVIERRHERAASFGTGIYSKSGSDWGYRTHPVTGELDAWHNGVDLSAPVIQGDPIHTPLDGVVEAAYEGDVSGYLLRISHDDPEFPEIEQTRYAHLSDWAVKKGDVVKRGQVVGYIGGAKNSPGAGLSTGTHLHFIVRLKPEYRQRYNNILRSDADPLPYLEASKKKLITASLMFVTVALGILYLITKK